MLAIEAVGQTDIGCVRRENEDAFIIHRFNPEDPDRSLGVLAVVADGVGGHAGGRQASTTSVEKIREYVERNLSGNPGEALVDAVEETHRFLKEMAQANLSLKGMGTTCTAIWANDGEAYVAQVGDSRAYLFRNGTYVQITEDQTLVQKLFKEGKISEEEIPNHPDRNIILQALGISETIDVDLFHLTLEPGDMLLLCSDGLHGLVKDREMIDIADAFPPAESAKKLVDLARMRGGHDNITAVILNVHEREARTSLDPEIGQDEGTDTKKHAVFPSNREKPRRRLALLLVLLGAALTAYLVLNFPRNPRRPDQPVQRTNQADVHSEP